MFAPDGPDARTAAEDAEEVGTATGVVGMRGLGAGVPADTGTAAVVAVVGAVGPEAERDGVSPVEAAVPATTAVPAATVALGARVTAVGGAAREATGGTAVAGAGAAPLLATVATAGVEGAAPPTAEPAPTGPVTGATREKSTILANESPAREAAATPFPAVVAVTAVVTVVAPPTAATAGFVGTRTGG